MSNAIKIERNGESMIVRFVRPAIRNPLSVFVLEELLEIVDGCDDSVARNSYLQEAARCSLPGADLREIAAVAPEGARELRSAGTGTDERDRGAKMHYDRRGQRVLFWRGAGSCTGLRRQASPTESAILASRCRAGIITGWGGTQRLPRKIGQAGALEMFFDASRVDAAEALRIGLVDKIAEDVISAALDW